MLAVLFGEHCSLIEANYRNYMATIFATLYISLLVRNICIVQEVVNFPIREINLSRPKKSVKWHAQSLEFFLSNLQYCLFMFGTVFKIIHIRCSFLSKSATVITKGAKIL